MIAIEEVKRRMLSTLADAYMARNAHKHVPADMPVVGANIEAMYNAIVDGVVGNRSRSSEAALEDILLIYAGVLRKALEILEGEQE